MHNNPQYCAFLLLKTKERAGPSRRFTRPDYKIQFLSFYFYRSLIDWPDKPTGTETGNSRIFPRPKILQSSGIFWDFFSVIFSP